MGYGGSRGRFNYTALTEYRAGRFDAAFHLFESLASSDEPARAFATRPRRWLESPPPQPWDAVERLAEK